MLVFLQGRHSTNIVARSSNDTHYKLIEPVEYKSSVNSTSHINNPSQYLQSSVGLDFNPVTGL